MATCVKALAKEILETMTLTEAIQHIEQYDEETKENLSSELFKQYHEKCAQEG